MARTTSRKKGKPGIKALKLKTLGLMLLFQSLQRLSPRLGSLMAYHLWFHPGRESVRRVPVFAPEGVREHHFRLNSKTVVYWSAGAGDTVFLMHGWAGCGNQMAPLARALLDQGFRVIWMDAPAHGRSGGWQTTLFEIARAMRHVQQQEGPFRAVLAHSFGVPSCLYAMCHEALQTDKFIAIAAPASFDSLVDNYCRIIRASPRTRDEFQRRFEKFLGDLQLADIAPATLARSISQPALVIHDRHDRILGPDEARLLHSNLPNARLVLTEKLGHSKILANAEVIKLSTDFVKDKTHQGGFSQQMTG